MDASGAMPSVLGAVILHPEETTRVFEALTPECFTGEDYRTIFETCLRRHRAGKTWDLGILVAELGEGYRYVLRECAEHFVIMDTLDAYIELVRENWRKETMARELQELIFTCAAPGSRAADVVGELSRLVEAQNRIQEAVDDETAKSFAESAAEFLVDLEAPDGGIRTGWRDLDYLTGGLQRQGVYVIAARSGQGKTDLALCLAGRLCRKVKVCYNSMEMPRKQLMQRIVSRVTRINSVKMRDKTLSDQEKASCGNAVAALAKQAKLILDEQAGITAQEVEAKILRHRPDVLVLDHLGLMRHDRNRRNLWEAIGETTKALKALALKYNLAIVELVQLTREADRGGEPSMSWLKGSSDIENDADGIFMIQAERPQEFIQGDSYLEAEVYLVKNRHGGTGALKFHWQPQYHTWIPVDTMR